VFFRGPGAAHVAVLTGLCALSLFAALGSTPLWEPDEPRFAAATRHMLRSGDYFDPMFNGRPRWEKPILLNWLQAAPLGLGLDDELPMRLPAATLGTVAVLCVYALGVFWWSRTAGLIGAALLATTFRFVTYARQGLTDIPAVAGIVATFLAFEIGSSVERAKRQHLAWWAGWTIVGLTALTKGPLALIAPTIWIAATWIRRRRDSLDRNCLGRRACGRRRRLVVHLHGRTSRQRVRSRERLRVPATILRRVVSRPGAWTALLPDHPARRNRAVDASDRGRDRRALLGLESS
jgi:hypothetical protein